MESIELMLNSWHELPSGVCERSAALPQSFERLPGFTAGTKPVWDVMDPKGLSFCMFCMSVICSLFALYDF